MFLSKGLKPDPFGELRRGLAHAEAPASLRGAWVPGPQQLTEQLLEFSSCPYSLSRPPKVTLVTRAMPTAFAMHHVPLCRALPWVLESPPLPLLLLYFPKPSRSHHSGELLEFRESSSLLEASAA